MAHVRKNGREARQAAAQSRVLTLLRETVQLYPPDKDWKTPRIVQLMKSDSPEDDKQAQASTQGTQIGRIAHPFNFAMVRDFKTSNPHHSACLDAKRNSTIGMGFKKQTTTKKLSELGTSDRPFMSTLSQAIDDYWSCGNGHLETRRNSEKKIIAAHFLPATDQHVFVEGNSYDTHFEITTRAGTNTRGTKAMASFGDRESFMTRASKDSSGISTEDAQNPSEIIRFANASNLSRYYGFPDWLAAVASIELIRAIKQQQFDFFINRGVPEMMLFILGGKVGTKDWEKIENALRATIGPGNQGKSIALNLWQEGIEVKLEKLGLEGKTDGGNSGEQLTTLSLDIVSAHRTPAIIAGIQVPGKMGATNEAMNAIWSFQLLTVGPAQESIKNVLKATFGKPEAEGGLGLSADDDFDMVTLTDKMDLGLGGKVDTMSRMKQELPEAKSEGRDLGAGLKKALDDMDEEKIGRLIGGVILGLVREAA